MIDSVVTFGRRVIGGLCLSVMWSFGATASPPSDVTAIDLREVKSIERIIPALADKRVIFIGETHDAYHHHLSQLAVIRALHKKNKNLAIGLEFFQQPFQEHLDAYVSGRISEKEMLRRTEYLERWRFDYRHYRPILQYAREHGIPLVALNVPRELTSKVAEGGIAQLPKDDRAGLPDIDRSNQRYRESLRQVYMSHPQRDGGQFEHFLDVQLLWDEGMAQRAADYLRVHQTKTMIVLAGTGHLAYGMGIPQRLERRLKVDTAIILNGMQEELTSDLADFVLLPATATLPPKGMLGILMVTGEKGVRIDGFSANSAAEAAGLQIGDHIVGIENEIVRTVTHVQLAFLDSRPGDKVELVIVRDGNAGKEEREIYHVTMRGEPEPVHP